MTPEELIQLQRLLASTAPGIGVSPDYANTMRSSAYENEAKQEEQRAAAPMVRPQGLKENAVSGIRAFIEGMAQPKTPFAGMERREDQYQADRATTLAKAKELRQRAIQEQQMGVQAQNRADDVSAREQTFNLQKRSQEFDEEIANRSKPAVRNPGDVYGTTSAQTGAFTKEGEVPHKPPTAVPGNFGGKPMNVEGFAKPQDIIEDLNPESPTFGKIFVRTAEGLQDVTGKVSHYESPAKYSEPFQTFFDPNQGENVLARRSDVPNFSTAPQAPGVLQAQQDAKSAAARVESLGSIYKPEYVGPYAGRYNTLAATGLVPGLSTPQGYTDFSAADAELRNDVIKAITGAQMNKNEEARIANQIPTKNDTPEMWQSKYTRTLRRVQTVQLLKDRQIGLSNFTVDQIDAMIDGKMPMPGSSTTATPPPTGGRGGAGTGGGLVKPGGAVEALLRGK
jgi:hypothetical protein